MRCFSSKCVLYVVNGNSLWYTIIEKFYLIREANISWANL